MSFYEDEFDNRISFSRYNGPGGPFVSVYCSDVCGAVSVEIPLDELEKLVREAKEGK